VRRRHAKMDLSRHQDVIAKRKCVTAEKRRQSTRRTIAVEWTEWDSNRDRVVLVFLNFKFCFWLRFFVLFSIGCSFSLHMPLH